MSTSNDPNAGVDELVKYLKEGSQSELKTDHKFPLSETELPMALAVKPSAPKASSRKPFKGYKLGDLFFNALSWKRVKGKLKVKGSSIPKFVYTLEVHIQISRKKVTDDVELSLPNPIHEYNPIKLFAEFVQRTYDVKDIKKVKGTVSYFDKNDKEYKIYSFTENKLLEV